MVRGRSWRARLGRLTFAGAVVLTLTLILPPLVLVLWLSFFPNARSLASTNPRWKI